MAGMDPELVLRQQQMQQMDTLFDFGEAAMPDAPDSTISDSQAHAAQFGTCVLHPHDDGCLCLGHTGQVDLADTSLATRELATDGDLNNDWTINFSNSILGYSKPEHPCEYCRVRQFDCFMTFEGQTGCSPCNALFRTCSFNRPTQERRPRNVVDTLHVVAEDEQQEFGTLTGTKVLTGIKTHEDRAQDRAQRKSGVRFSKPAIRALTEWIVAHSDHPYPTEQEKDELRQKTGLSETQMNNWFANARRRKKHMPRRMDSDGSGASSAIDIPNLPNQSWKDLNPMERWKISPPENEPAPLTAIAQAVRQHTPPLENGSSAHTSRHGSSASSGPQSRRAPSSASLEVTSVNSALSSQDDSFGSIFSFDSGNSRHSWGSFGSFGPKGIRKERRRRRRQELKSQKPGEDGRRMFQCTFCTDTFKSKYDWSRHEKSLHLSLEKWICAPLGPVITCTASGQRKCVFCEKIDPSKEHLENHNWTACEEKSPEQRTFYRKDHLRQHMRLMHDCKLNELMESWKSETTYIRSRCGFCRKTFDTWQDRVDHLAKEFRNGALMKDWKGCRGFDPQVALLVTNAMPPYLIGSESKTPNPFKASEPASLAWHLSAVPDPGVNRYETVANAGFFHPDQEYAWASILQQEGIGPTTSLPSNNMPTAGAMSATAWEILTVRLGRYTKMQMSHGITPTDNMLQREARRIIYDEDDGWEQTAADNPEWLELFKKAHGIIDAGNNFDRGDTLEDLGMLGDVQQYLVENPLQGFTPATQPTSIQTSPTNVSSGFPSTTAHDSSCPDDMMRTTDNYCAKMMLGGPNISWGDSFGFGTSLDGGGDLSGGGLDFQMDGLEIGTGEEIDRRQTWNGFPNHLPTSNSMP
ncbi:uncharacterized protein J3D65DRAFT_619834 [Phyllosticta citribraziliensis]|uniref:Uncharacterized protein n=1 Tax=Phyllosticta citribraziliensis TaxID=989973 RepID=A0ABR1LYW6_9PEZI